ncbi:MAG TPA: hypothetical protein VGH34_20635 [Vicinamibacterales bacterium]
MAAISVVPLPRKGSKTASLRRVWFKIGISNRRTGFCVLCPVMLFSPSRLPPKGLRFGTSHMVVCVRSTSHPASAPPARQTTPVHAPSDNVRG